MLYLLIGGNLGNRLSNLYLAQKYINETVGEIVGTSTIYETAAWGKTDQPAFLNQVLVVKTDLETSEVLVRTQAVEQLLGRKRLHKWHARTMDIDILMDGQKIIDTPDLKVPHPFLHQRRFALVPLVELAPDLIHPIFHLNVEKLLNQCEDKLEVIKFEGKTT